MKSVLDMSGWFDQVDAILQARGVDVTKLDVCVSPYRRPCGSHERRNCLHGHVSMQIELIVLFITFCLSGDDWSRDCDDDLVRGEEIRRPRAGSSLRGILEKEFGARQFVHAAHSSQTLRRAATGGSLSGDYW